MMRKYLPLIIILAGCLVSCGKAEKDEPYVPWRPEDQKEDSITFDKATRLMILSEQAENKVVMIDQPTGKLAWDWSAEKSELSASQVKWFSLPDECKPVKDKSCVLVTASGGGVALVRISDKAILFAANAGGNPHSAEILPDGSIVVASSTGNKLQVYKCPSEGTIGAKAASSLKMDEAHNVVWDKKRNCLWTASGKYLYKLSYNESDCSLTQEYSYDLPEGNTTAHDLTPAYGEDELYVTTQQHVYRFNPESGIFAEVSIFQQKDIKSVSTGPEGWPSICTRPTSSSWWTSEVADFKGNRLFSYFKYQIYKARWYVDQPFSY